ncbi:MAG: three-Cys-motif partner protein TcmP [Gammaproteobacteria bacterium]|nr:three-Cys-motif partner protein TcmP [Gammaproteobacteria bacterium]MYB37398.1 three-Cys-motif partner protein TcmP [Gammaproteobacteria bacterium]
MAKATLWALDEQTEGKHLLLRSYLDGWFPILGSFNRRLLFVDGFAGPGEYAGGEAGSPLVALESVRRHRQEGNLQGLEVVFLFIESDKRHADHLEAVLGRDKSRCPEPKLRSSVASSKTT